jgi:hypothetical protein
MIIINAMKLTSPLVTALARVRFILLAFARKGRAKPPLCVGRARSRLPDVRQ